MLIAYAYSMMGIVGYYNKSIGYEEVTDKTNGLDEEEETND